MPRRIRCDCGTVIPLDRDQMGRRIKCPSCRKVFVADEEDDPRDRDADEWDEEPSSRPRKRPGEKRARRKDPSAPRTEGALGRLAVTLRQPLWSLGVLVLTALMLASLVVGLWMTFGSSNKPKLISLSKLVAEGVEDGRYVDLTEFYPAKILYYHSVEGPFQVGNRPERKWTDAYVALFPRTKQAGKAGEEGPEPDAVHVLLHMTSVSDEKDVENLATRSQLRGLAHYSTRTLDSRMTDAIKQSHPKTDFSRIIIFDRDRKPNPSLGGLIWMLIGGFGFLGCAFLLYVLFKR